ALHLDGAELAQVIGYELRIEQREAACNQPGDQMYERDFRSIALDREHALTEEGSAQRQAVQPSDQPVIPPYADGVAVAQLEEFPVERADAGIDPRRPPTRPRSRAAVDNGFEFII